MKLSGLLLKVPNADAPSSPAEEDLDKDFTFAFGLSDKQLRVTSSTASGRGNTNNESFLAANIINEEFIRGSWGSSVPDLVDMLGEENVFVSIYENKSGPGTSNALRAF
jgi:hypothetical protein